jgi:Fe-S-cluster-containing dehydrogenase component
LVCRKCEQASCVESCPQDALEKKEDEILKRFNMLCISCKSCTLACPFGTIYPEYVPYIMPKCDYCVGRSKESEPICVGKCPYKALEFRELLEERPKENIYFLGDNLAVHSRIKWERIEE